MGEKVCETIPCESFKNRLARTREALNKGFEVINCEDNIICIDYTTKGWCNV